jgi:penicillin-binding protein 2
MPERKIKNEIEKSKKFYSNRPIIIKSNLTFSEIDALQKNNMEGVYIVPINSRYGPNSLAVHLVGHLGSIDQVSWERLRNENININQDKAYKNDDLIGVKGIEEVFEPYLRSVNPSYSLQATIDAHGRPLLGLGFKKLQSTEGLNSRNNVILTIDKRVQKRFLLLEKFFAKGGVPIQLVYLTRHTFYKV